MADFQSVKWHFDSQKLPYYSFPKYEKPIKAVIRHLPQITPAEDISDGLVSLGIDVVNVKQMTATRRSHPEESKIIYLPLFLVTLPRTAKYQENLRLSRICHIAIRLAAYRAKNALTQCYNCQQFGHVWTYCKQRLRCLWYGSGHLYMECPEKGNTPSTPTCCNYLLAEGEKPHLPIIGAADTRMRRCRKKKSQRTPRTTTGRVFSSNLPTPGMSFAAAL
jgi:hypothetical protein